MDYVIAAVIGAAAGVVVAEVTTPRWKPLPAISWMVVMLTLLFTVVSVFTDWVGFSPFYAGILAQLATGLLYSAYLWSRTPMPISGSYWWWVGQTIAHPNHLARIHRVHTTSPLPHRADSV